VNTDICQRIQFFLCDVGLIERWFCFFDRKIGFEFDLFFLFYFDLLQFE